MVDTRGWSWTSATGYVVARKLRSIAKTRNPRLSHSPGTNNDQDRNAGYHAAFQIHLLKPRRTQPPRDVLQRVTSNWRMNPTSLTRQRELALYAASTCSEHRWRVG
jgi:hypothetical protein